MISKSLINFRDFIYYIMNRLNFMRKNIEYNRTLKCKGFISIYGAGSLKIGKNVKINSGKAFNPIGGDTRACFTLRGGTIIIDENSGLSNCTLVSDSMISIGKNVNVGGGVKIYDTDFHNISPLERLGETSGNYYGKSLTVIIENNVFIGAHSIILKGVKIGENSIIGAGSVVTKSVPKNQIWAGNPAKFIKNLSE